VNSNNLIIRTSLFISLGFYISLALNYFHLGGGHSSPAALPTIGYTNMKFGQNLPRNQVPEWASAYINYKGLKKLIKAAVQHSTEAGGEVDLAGGL
jgi:hypothetical protein